MDCFCFCHEKRRLDRPILAQDALVAYVPHPDHPSSTPGNASRNDVLGFRAPPKKTDIKLTRTAHSYTAYAYTK